MTEFFQLVSMLREQMHATLSRSDILRALILPLAMLVSSILILALASAPHWILIVFAVMFVLVALLYGSSFVYCLLKNPDALRSEKYVLNKMAIEHKLVGDSNAGVFEIEPSGQAAIEASTKRIEDKS
jgi:membrane protein implicated in regulation of membrane protease activity